MQRCSRGGTQSADSTLSTYISPTAAPVADLAGAGESRPLSSELLGSFQSLGARTNGAGFTFPEDVRNIVFEEQRFTNSTYTRQGESRFGEGMSLSLERCSTSVSYFA